MHFGNFNEVSCHHFQQQQWLAGVGPTVFHKNEWPT
jgi:hypothetical protein